MDLALVSAVELLGLADEDVIPLAAEMADASASASLAALEYRVRIFHDDFQQSHDRTALLSLVAMALVLLMAHPRTSRLRQSAPNTRPVVLSTEEFAAFRLGRLRAVTFPLGVYNEPREGDVLRLLERGENGWTGRDAIAEVLFVAKQHELYVVSMRPWRGAGTDSFEAALLQDRRDALCEVASGLATLTKVCPSGTWEGRVREAALRSLDRAMTLSITANDARAAMAAE